MSKKSKASPVTQVTEAESGGNEKKRKKKNLMPLCIGVVITTFVAIALIQTRSALSNINDANVVYTDNMTQMAKAEEKRIENVIQQQHAQDQNQYVQNDVSTETESEKDDTYVKKGNKVIYTDSDGKKIIYHICKKCTKCGAKTKGKIKCKKCGCNLYKYVVYKVKKGDTLSHISGKVGASVRSIANMNEIDNVNLIYDGESLRIPD